MATSKFKFLERYPKILNVVIKPIDVKKSSGYGSINDCYLATALKRMRYRNPVVGADNVDFYAKEVRYEMSQGAANKIMKIGRSPFPKAGVEIRLKRTS